MARMGRPPTLKVLPSNPINARIAKLFDASGMSQVEFAKKCGVSAAAVWRWLSDERAPAVAAVPAIAQALDVSADFLLAGKERTPTVTSERKDSRPVPLVGVAAAGVAMAKIYESQDVQWFDFPVDFLRALYKTAPDPERAVLMRVDGDSMGTELPHGSFVFVDRGPGGEGFTKDKIRDDDVYMVRPPGDDGVTLKRVSIDGPWIHLMPSPGARGHKVRSFPITRDTKIQSIVRGRVVGKIERY